MKSNYEERAKKFIAQIADYLEGCMDYYDYEMATEYFNHVNKRAVKFAHGMTRAAFITSDYVVKIDCPEYEGCLEKFGGCENEISVYEKAEKEGFSFLFAKISRYEYNGIKYYIMPRIKYVGRCYDDAEYFIDSEAFKWLKRNGIVDLHNQNYGWLNDRVVIFDYACHE